MIKKFLAQILVAIVLICGAAFTLSACGSSNTGLPDPPPGQSTENGDGNDSEEENNGQNGIWTPPAKQ